MYLKLFNSGLTKWTWVFIILFLLCNEAFGQNYIEYQKIISRVDDDIVANELQRATQRLDTLHNQYDFVFAKHCIKALQICCANNDSVNACKWLAKCFKQGVPLWIVRNNELTQKVFNYQLTAHTINSYDSLRTIYKSSINIDLARQIDSLMTIDQRKTKRLNDGFILWRYTIYYPQWLRNNKRQFALLTTIIDKYGFPGEQLIGLPSEYEDSATSYKNIMFYGPHLYEGKAYIMLIHYYSNSRKDINGKLLKNVLNGNLPPYQYGALNDFMALYGKGRNNMHSYYNVWHTDPNENNIDSINARRALIGLSTNESKKRNNVLWFEQRKNKVANASIILE